ncbi:MAG: thermonuclease family protein [Hyphomicrobium sp.]
MFGWFKRNDGFEWHDYVRTTILLRRRKRRERLAEAGRSAVRGMKEAGRRGAAAGVEGVQELGRSAVAAGQQGAAMGVAGVHAAQDKVRAGVPIVWTWICAAGRRLRSGLALLWELLRAAGRSLGRGSAWLWVRARAGSIQLGHLLAAAFAASVTRLEPAFAALRQPHIRAPLVILGFAAVLGAVVRIFVKGFDLDVVIALLVGLVILGCLFLTQRSGGGLGWPDFDLRDRTSNLASMGPAAIGATAVVAALMFVAGAGWILWQNAPALPALPSLTLASSIIEGRGVAISGDTLRVAGRTLRLDGIEAPVPGQRCLRGKSRRWDCGASATAFLARLVRRARVTCEISGSDDRDRPLGDCRIGDKDLAAELVRGGHVFATTGFFAPYTSLEDAARKAKLGVWRGEAVRPSDYRAQKWEEAKRAAPDGCPIKGNVSRGRRIYVLPWSRDYKRVRITRRRGERWFCSETEAQAAGWKPAGSSESSRVDSAIAAASGQSKARGPGGGPEDRGLRNVTPLGGTGSWAPREELKLVPFLSSWQLVARMPFQ